MISRTVLAIGLLLGANHVANAYILLSANIEDIKKVASKFLSSDIVEQLTRLIGKFKSDNKINLSEENKKNEKTVNRISDDDIEERATIRPKATKSKPKHETEKRDRYEISEFMNKISQEKQKSAGRYKIAVSANQLSKDESEERPRHKNTPDSMRQKDTNDNRQNKERKDREGDLYWNDDEERIERVVATSGRLKLPRENRGVQKKYNWDISSEN